MEITAEQLRADPGHYIVYDIRSERERAYGTIPDSYGSTAEELLNTPPTDRSRPLVILCAHGIVSLDVAEALEARGYEAYSLRGGYLAWLRADLQDKQEEEVRARVEQSLRKKFRTPLMSQFTKALKAYRLVNEGDRVAVCISGGKDSMLMAKLFQELQSHGRQNFEVVYLVMNPGYNQLNAQAVLDNARLLGIPIEVFHTEIFDIVANQGGSPCYLCARMRRGYLYSKARELGCNKIALGHHYDDVIETILMGMLYGSQIQTMMPKLHSTNFPGMELIRPLYLIREKDILRWRDYNDLHFIQCACRLTESCASCGGTEKGSKRAEIKRLIHNLSKEDPQIPARIFRSVENVNLDTVIAYKQGGTVHRFLDSYDE